MNLIKKFVVSIVIMILVLASFVPSSYADFTPKQEAQMHDFLVSYVQSNEGHTIYSQGTLRNNIFKNIRTSGGEPLVTHPRSCHIFAPPGKLASDCSSFVSYVYWYTCGLKDFYENHGYSRMDNR